MHQMNQKQQLILSNKPSIQKEEKALAQVSGEDNQLRQINLNILDEGERKSGVQEVLQDDLDWTQLSSELDVTSMNMIGKTELQYLSTDPINTCQNSFIYMSLLLINLWFL